MKRILIADDSKASRLYLQCILDELIPDTCEFAFACNGIEAIELFHAAPADLVFLDLTMPGKNGMDVLVELREAFPETKVIILTADTQQVTRDRAHQLGALDFITKPITPEVFQERVPKWL